MTLIVHDGLPVHRGNVSRLSRVSNIQTGYASPQHASANVAVTLSRVAVCFVLQWPMTTDTSAWYFGTGAGVLAVVLATAAYGSYTSLGNKPAVSAS